MRKYHNLMEALVEAAFDELKPRLDCCTCEQCRNDIIAYALNQLRPKYVSTDKGAVYTKIDALLNNQPTADIITAIIAGVNVVRGHERHGTNGNKEDNGDQNQ